MRCNSSFSALCKLAVVGLPSCGQEVRLFFRSRVFGSGCDEAIFSEKHRVLQGAAQRGSQFDFMSALLGTMSSCRIMSLFYLKTCTQEAIQYMRGVVWILQERQFSEEVRAIQ